MAISDLVVCIIGNCGKDSKMAAFFCRGRVQVCGQTGSVSSSDHQCSGKIVSVYDGCFISAECSEADAERAPQGTPPCIYYITRYKVFG
jgi:hypothetical protein